MIIPTHSHLCPPPYTGLAKKEKTAPGFAIPDRQGTPLADKSDAPVNENPGTNDEESLQEYLRSKAKVWPHDVGLVGEDAIEFLKSKMAPILYEFTENGPTRIKEGLSPEERRIAQRYLAAMQPFPPGLG